MEDLVVIQKCRSDRLSSDVEPKASTLIFEGNNIIYAAVSGQYPFFFSHSCELISD